MWPFKSTQGDDQSKPPTSPDNLAAKQTQSTNPSEPTLVVPSLVTEDRGQPLSETDTESTLESRFRLSQRLGIDPVLRGAAISAISFVAGFSIGSAHGTVTAGLRYRAENAHHQPTSKAGWYLYQKSRNYHAIVGGVTGGLNYGARYAGLAMMFAAFEEGIDRARGRVFAGRGEVERKGQRDFLSTVSAAIAMSGIYSRWNDLDRFAAMRLTKTALRVAVPYGIMQDLVASITEDRPWYVSWILKKTVARSQQDPVI